MRFCKSSLRFQHPTYQTPSNGFMICCELLLKTLCRVPDHPITSDPQKWLYEILKTLQMLLALNMSDPWNGSMICCELFLKTICRIRDHPATSDPQKWLYEILKILQMLLAFNISDPLKWLDDMLWTLPENPMSDPWPSSYLRPPEMALWDTENPPNILSLQYIRPPQMARWYVVNSSCEPYIGS